MEVWEKRDRCGEHRRRQMWSEQEDGVVCVGLGERRKIGGMEENG